MVSSFVFFCLFVLLLFLRFFSFYAMHLTQFFFFKKGASFLSFHNLLAAS